MMWNQGAFAAQVVRGGIACTVDTVPESIEVISGGYIEFEPQRQYLQYPRGNRAPAFTAETQRKISPFSPATQRLQASS